MLNYLLDTLKPHPVHHECFHIEFYNIVISVTGRYIHTDEHHTMQYIVTPTMHQ